MTVTISDEALAYALNQLGGATLEQIEAARQAQAESAKQNIQLSLADALIQQGVITPAIRDNVEKKCQAQQEGGIKQLGTYKLLKKLGEGSMGTVFLAEDAAMGRRVALKVLAKKHAGNSDFMNRFRREARAAGQLNHVNIDPLVTTPS